MSEAVAVLETSAAAEATTEIALVDLSSIAYPIWHMSGSQPDPDWTSQQIIARVRGLTSNHQKAAICCDSGKSFRNELSPNYKAQRETAPASLFHQIDLAKQALEADGYPVWAARGFEADDLIASATRQALAFSDTSVLVFSGDKDLLQLVGPRVRVQSTNNGTVYDADGVRAKFGVDPAQIGDYLALVGDSADNVKGADGIGPKKAAGLLQAFGSLAGIYLALTNHGSTFKPAIATALREFEARKDQTVQLITLRQDVDLPFAELDNDRASKAAPMEGEAMETGQATVPATAVVGDVVPVSTSAPVVEAKPVNGNANGQTYGTPTDRGGWIAPAMPTPPAPSPATIDVPASAPVEFEKQLEPRSIGQAMQLANAMFKAKLFNGYGTPEAVLSTVLMGRELGLQATASLRAFHLIEGKHALAADAMRGLVLRSGVAKYFRCVERTAKRVTFETLRVGEPEPIRLSYERNEGRTAFGFYDGMPEALKLEREKAWSKSAWARHPADMLAARASSKLARLVYSDILFGLYSPAELSDNATV